MDRLDASRRRASAPGAGASGPDLAGFAEGMLRWYADMGRLWMECLTAYVPGSDAIRSGRSATGAALSLDITSSRPVRATLEVFEPIGERLLDATDLHATASGQPPLRDVQLHSGGRDAAPVLCLRVPDEAPADTYSGAIVDRASGREVGRINVRVST